MNLINTLLKNMIICALNKCAISHVLIPYLLYHNEKKKIEMENDIILKLHVEKLDIMKLAFELNK